MGYRAPMSTAELSALVGFEPGAATLKCRADREKRRWRGVRLQLGSDGVFVVSNSWEVRDDLRGMGFRWNPTARTWGTDDVTVAAKLSDRAVGAAKEKLVPQVRMHKAKATFERAATRLEPGDEERVRQTLTPTIAAAIRLAVAVLAKADDDKATVVNSKGFSKADTELGHTLFLSGVKTYREAALALRLTWRYRGQLPAQVVEAAFPVHGDDEPSEAEKNAFVAQAEAEAVSTHKGTVLSASQSDVALTREQANAIAEFFDTDADAAFEQLEASGAYVPGEPTMPYGFPGQNQTRTRVAAVEQGRSLFYVEEDDGARHWLEVGQA